MQKILVMLVIIFKHIKIKKLNGNWIFALQYKVSINKTKPWFTLTSTQHNFLV